MLFLAVPQPSAAAVAPQRSTCSTAAPRRCSGCATKEMINPVYSTCKSSLWCHSTAALRRCSGVRPQPSHRTLLNRRVVSSQLAAVRSAPAAAAPPPPAPAPLDPLASAAAAAPAFARDTAPAFARDTAPAALPTFRKRLIANWPDKSTPMCCLGGAQLECPPRIAWPTGVLDKIDLQHCPELYRLLNEGPPRPGWRTRPPQPFH